jgi:hypothetical protein
MELKPEGPDEPEDEGCGEKWQVVANALIPTD